MTATLLGVGISAACVAGLRMLRDAGPRRAIVPVLTVTCVVILGGFSFAQLTTSPWLLPLLMREPYPVIAEQPWRLVTSLLVQDGGWAGTVANLLGLLAGGGVAELLLGRFRWMLIGVITVLSAQACALAWQPTGAGNSILDLGLAGAICGLTLCERPNRLTVLTGVAGLVSFLGLLAMRDIHGVAGTVGAIGAAALWRNRCRALLTQGHSREADTPRRACERHSARLIRRH